MMRMTTWLSLVATCATFSLAACKTSESGTKEGSSNPATNGIAGGVSPATYDAALTTLAATGLSSGLGSEATDRVSACWKNPKTADYSDMRKLAYCYMPLQFRICNSFILLATSQPSVQNQNLRLKAYDTCAKSSDQMAVLNDDGMRKTYLDLFLMDGAALSQPQKDTIMAKFKPQLMAGTYDELFKSSFYSLGPEFGDTKSTLKRWRVILAPIPGLIGGNLLDRLKDGISQGDLLATFSDVF